MNSTKSRSAVAVAAAVMAALTVGACGNSANEQATQSSAETSATSPAQSDHNQSDVMFARHMIPHHQQAIEMSDMVMGKQGIDPRVVDMAKQIRDEQAPEIEAMQGWLDKWGMPSMPMRPGMDMPGQGDMPGRGPGPGPGPMPSGSMPPGGGGMPMMDGMMSQAEMDALRNAQGIEASRLFLDHMIRHHEGAITMSQREVDDGQYQPTVELARQIVTDQQKEIDTMKQIRESL